MCVDTGSSILMCTCAHLTTLPFYDWFNFFPGKHTYARYIYRYPLIRACAAIQGIPSNSPSGGSLHLPIVVIAHLWNQLIAIHVVSMSRYIFTNDITPNLVCAIIIVLTHFINIYKSEDKLHKLKVYTACSKFNEGLTFL